MVDERLMSYIGQAENWVTGMSGGLKPRANTKAFIKMQRKKETTASSNSFTRSDS
jgi:hypothetical protein